MAPLLVGAFNPGDPRSAAHMRGYLRSKQQIEQQQMQRQQMGRQEQVAQAQIGNITADNQRQQQMLELAQEQAGLRRTESFYDQLPDLQSAAVEQNTDPAEAQAQFIRSKASAAQDFGVPLSAGQRLPNMGVLVSRKQKKHAQDLLDRFDKEWGDQPEAADMEQSTISFGPFKGQTFAQLRVLAQQPVPKAPSKPAQAGSENERAAHLLDKIAGAKAVGDTAAAAKFQAQYDNLVMAKRDLGRADDKPTDSAGGGALTPGMESNVLNRLTAQWTAASKPAVDLARQIKMMEAGLDAARRGDLAQGAQAVLVTFQKVLDPTSVVRESEYARSSAGLALDDRIRGAMERLAKGGAGVPLAELEKFARVAQEAVKKQTGGYLDAVKGRIGKTADRYKIPRDIVFEDFDFGSPTTDAGVKYRIGQTVTLKDGRTVTIKALNPDGTFEY